MHTLFMRFPIDVVFLGGDDQIVAIRPNIRPWRVVGARGARSVLELPAGEAERRKLNVGERLEGAASGSGARRRLLGALARRA